MHTNSDVHGINSRADVHEDICRTPYAFFPTLPNPTLTYSLLVFIFVIYVYVCMSVCVTKEIREMSAP